MAEQHDVAQILIADHVQDVLDMGFQIDRGSGEMLALAQPRIGRRQQPMAGRLHQGMHLLP
jgi:hypothetical protein